MDVTAVPARPNFTGLSFRDLEYVVAVADFGSFIRAAQHCHVAQPSLSVQVRRIEERLNTPIFERSSRGVSLTHAGHAIVGQMRRALAEGRALLALAQRPDVAFGGTLRLSAIATVAPYLFPKMLPELRSTFPSVEYLLAEGRSHQLLEAVASGDIDAAIVTAPAAHRHVECHPVLHEPLWMACPESHDAARDDGPDWHELSADSRLFLDEQDCLRAHAVRAAGAAGGGHPSSSLEGLMYRVAAGEGCTLMPAFAARPLPGVVYRTSMRPDRQRLWLLARRANTVHGEAIDRLAATLSALMP
jgi:LysR family hydrogen peroxide-inducible transcriptional activator